MLWRVWSAWSRLCEVIALHTLITPGCVRTPERRKNIPSCRPSFAQSIKTSISSLICVSWKCQRMICIDRHDIYSDLVYWLFWGCFFHFRCCDQSRGKQTLPTATGAERKCFQSSNKASLLMSYFWLNAHRIPLWKVRLILHFSTIPWRRRINLTCFTWKSLLAEEKKPKQVEMSFLFLPF